MRKFAWALFVTALPWGRRASSCACCSDRDCWPMGLSRDAKEPDRRIVPGWHMTHDGTFVPGNAARVSKDGRFHVCRRAGILSGAVIAPSENPFCLFVPKPGS